MPSIKRNRIYIIVKCYDDSYTFHWFVVQLNHYSQFSIFPPIHCITKKIDRQSICSYSMMFPLPTIAQKKNIRTLEYDYNDIRNDIIKQIALRAWMIDITYQRRNYHQKFIVHQKPEFTAFQPPSDIDIYFVINIHREWFYVSNTYNTISIFVDNTPRTDSFPVDKY